LNLSFQVPAIKPPYHAKRKKTQASQDGDAQAEEASSQKPSQEEVMSVVRGWPCARPVLRDFM
jgi:hypothetical protein